LRSKNQRVIDSNKLTNKKGDKMKKYDKKIIASYSKYLDGEGFEVIILDDGDYYNVHILSEKFKDYEMNTLHLQVTKESVTVDYFTNQRLITYLMDFFMWDRFYKELGDDFVIYTTLEQVIV